MYDLFSKLCSGPLQSIYPRSCWAGQVWFPTTTEYPIMSHQALWSWSALKIRDAVRGKAISATEVVKAHLDRIDAINPQINAIVTLVPDLALAQAQGPAPR